MPIHSSASCAAHLLSSAEWQSFVTTSGTPVFGKLQKLFILPLLIGDAMIHQLQKIIFSAKNILIIVDDPQRLLLFPASSAGSSPSNSPRAQ